MEGVFESLKEPAEVGAESLSQLISEGTLPDGLEYRPREAVKAALTVAPISGITGAETGTRSHYHQADLTKMADNHHRVDQVFNDILGGKIELSKLLR